MWHVFRPTVAALAGVALAVPAARIAGATDLKVDAPNWLLFVLIGAVVLVVLVVLAVVVVVAIVLARRRKPTAAAGRRFPPVEPDASSVTDHK